MSDSSDTELEIDTELDGAELERDVESLREALEADNRRDKATTEPSENLTLQKLELCLVKNRELQSTLCGYLSDIEKSLRENKRKRSDLNQYGRGCLKRACNIWKFRRSKSYFSDYEGKHPPLKSSIISSAGINNFSFQENTWHTSKEDISLKKHVLAQAIEIACRPLAAELANLSDKEDQEKIVIIKEQMKEMSNLSDDDCLLKDLDPDDICWFTVAYEAFNNRKTPSDCRLRWVNEVSPAVNKSPWTKEEDIKLMKLGKELGGRRWKEVAEKIGTNRSIFSYFKRYVTTFNGSQGGMFWSEEMVMKLKEAVARHGDNWLLVSRAVGYTPSMCRYKWNKQVNPAIKKGRWTPAEDEQLLEAINKFSAKDWNKIACMVPNRTSAQCRERWANVLDPNVSNSSWSTEEDEKLIELCKQYKGNVIPWAEVAQSLPSRTDCKCAARWRLLSSEDEVISYYKRAKMKKKIKLGGKKAPSTLDITDFEDDMIPENLQEELLAESNRIRNKIRSSPGSKKDMPRYEQNGTDQPFAGVKLNPVLDIGDMLSTEDLLKFGAIPLGFSDHLLSSPQPESSSHQFSSGSQMNPSDSSTLPGRAVSSSLPPSQLTSRPLPHLLSVQQLPVITMPVNTASVSRTKSGSNSLFPSGPRCITRYVNVSQNNTSCSNVQTTTSTTCTGPAISALLDLNQDKELVNTSSSLQSVLKNSSRSDDYLVDDHEVFVPESRGRSGKSSNDPNSSRVVLDDKEPRCKSSNSFGNNITEKRRSTRIRERSRMREQPVSRNTRISKQTRSSCGKGVSVGRKRSGSILHGNEIEPDNNSNKRTRRNQRSGKKAKNH